MLNPRLHRNNDNTGKSFSIGIIIQFLSRISMKFRQPTNAKSKISLAIESKFTYIIIIMRQKNVHCVVNTAILGGLLILRPCGA